jgi:hypothetical protein
MLVEAIQASLREAENGIEPSGKATDQQPSAGKSIEDKVTSRRLTSDRS